MKRMMFLIILMLFISQAFSQSYVIKSKDTTNNKAIAILTKEYQGTLFEENYDLQFLFFIDTVVRWTPTFNDIRVFEKKLRNSVRLRMILSFRKREFAYINKRLIHYRRQYVGIIDQSKKFVWVNFYLDHPFQNPELPDHSILEVLGGGANFFNCWFDCNRRKIKSIYINAPE